MAGLNMVEFLETKSPLWLIPVLSRELVYCQTVFSERNLSSFVGWTSQPGWKKEDYELSAGEWRSRAVLNYTTEDSFAVGAVMAMTLREDTVEEENE